MSWRMLERCVGAGTTRLAVTLWFDASAPLDAEMLPEAARGGGKLDDDDGLAADPLHDATHATTVYELFHAPRCLIVAGPGNPSASPPR